MSKIVSPFEVADCNKALAEAGLPGRIRLHDACGGQSLSYEGEDGLTAASVPENVRTWLEGHLSRLRYRPVFDDRSGYFRIA